MATASSGIDAGQQAFANMNNGWVSGNVQTQVLKFCNDLKTTFKDDIASDHPAINFLAILACYASNMGLLGSNNGISMLSDMSRSMMAMMFYCDDSLGNISSAAATAVLASYNARF